MEKTKCKGCGAPLSGNAAARRHHEVGAWHQVARTARKLHAEGRSLSEIANVVFNKKIFSTPYVAKQIIWQNLKREGL